MLESRLARASRFALYCVVLGAPVAFGAHRGWPLAFVQLAAFLAVALWIVRALVAGRLEWRRTALDLPISLLVGLVVVQIVVGNRPLASWALGPIPADPELPASLPLALFAVGAVTPSQTVESLLLLLAYACVYFLATQALSHRSHLDAFIRVLVLAGGVLAVFALGDHLAGGGWTSELPNERLKGRLTGTFVNPDHFGTWLAMLVCVGLGYLAARRRGGRERRSLLDVFTRASEREDAIRRYLPFLAIGVMTVALMFTLSRGAIVSLVAALAAALCLLARLGLARWSLVLVGVLLAATVAGGTIIGLEPFLARVQQADGLGTRWIQTVTSLPMLASFPVLGVGLGGYRDIYFRYQPVPLKPGQVYYPYAHNDMVQLVLEVGVVGFAIAAFAAWRAGTDLVGAHLLGRARCPVGGGEGKWAQRSDPFTLGAAIGGLAAVTVLLAHSLFDFTARIPANGLLGAACLGIATVALHTRFGAEQRLLTRVATLRLDTPARRVAGVFAAAALLTVPGTMVVRTALAQARTQLLERPDAAGRVREATPPWLEHRTLLTIRSRLALQGAQRAWYEGSDTAGRRLDSRDARASEARALLDVAVADARRALTMMPTYPFLHERLARAHALIAAIEPERGNEALRMALAHIQRALALAPDVARLHQALAEIALARPGPVTPATLRATREATAKDPTLLDGLAARLVPRNLADAEWLAAVPDTTVDRLQLAMLLERHGAVRDALPVYRAAVQAATPSEAAVARWFLAGLLIRQGGSLAAETELEVALKADPDNPELHLSLGESRAQRGDPGALDAYRIAVHRAEQHVRRGLGETMPFAGASQRFEALVRQRLPKGEGFQAVRYRRVLAAYLADRKLWDAAVEEWRAIVTDAAGDARAHLALGLALDGAGRRSAAVDAYRDAVSLDGGNVRYRLRLASALWDTEQYYQAMLEWQEVERRDPRNVEATLGLARAFARGGDRVSASARYRRVLDLAPDHADARAELARLGPLR